MALPSPDQPSEAAVLGLDAEAPPNPDQPSEAAVPGLPVEALLASLLDATEPSASDVPLLDGTYGVKLCRVWRLTPWYLAGKESVDPDVLNKFSL